MKRPAPSESRQIAVAKAFLAELASTGEVDLAKPVEEIWDQFLAATNDIDDSFDPVIDHTPDLLFRARQSRKEKNFSMSVLMYATWVEHTLNMMILNLAVKKLMLKSHFNTMIKEASIRSKSTWLLPLLGGKTLSPITITRIQKLADSRNAFIHYKWGQTVKAAKFDQINALEDAEKLVKTLQRYRISVTKRVSPRSKSVRRVFAGAA